MCRLGNCDECEKEREMEFVRHEFEASRPVRKVSVHSGPPPVAAIPVKVKRSVSFADDHGISLVEVREIEDAIAGIHRRHTIEREMNVATHSKQPNSTVRSRRHTFSGEWTQLLRSRSVVSVLRHNVQLESAEVVQFDNGDLRLRGTVLVANVHFEKRVTIRYSSDRWQTQHDVPAYFAYPEGSCDRFAFDELMPPETPPSDIELCVRYRIGQRANRKEFWDNNNDCNYELNFIHQISPSEDLAMMVADQNSPKDVAQILMDDNKFMTSLNDVVFF